MPSKQQSNPWHGPAKRGFGALSSLASTVDDAPTKSRAADERPPQSPPPTPPRPSPQQPASGTPYAPSRVRQPSRAKWFWIVAGAAVLGWVFYGSQGNLNRSSSPPPTTTTFTPSPAPAPIPAPAPVPAAVDFAKPSVGRDNVLSVAQIRWCLREEITLDTQRPLVITDQQLLRFNAGVDDYNLRCGSFRYRPGDLERARREVEQKRAEIVAAAKRLLP